MLMKPPVADKPYLKQGKVLGLNPSVFFLGVVSLLAGWLWQTFSPAAPFYLGAGLAFVAMLGMLALIRE